MPQALLSARPCAGCAQFSRDAPEMRTASWDILLGVYKDMCIRADTHINHACINVSVHMIDTHGGIRTHINVQGG